MITVTIEYFALLGDQAGRQSEQLQTDATMPSEVYQQLQVKYSFSLKQNNLKAAVNDEFVSWDHKLADGDKIVFIPPVSGG